MTVADLIALACLVLAVPAGLFGFVSMLRLARELNRDQRNSYRLPPKWMEGGK